MAVSVGSFDRPAQTQVMGNNWEDKAVLMSGLDLECITANLEMTLKEIIINQVEVYP